MDWTFAAYGAATLAVLAFAWFATPHADRKQATWFAWIMVAQWALGRLALVFLGFPAGALISPPMDALTLLFVTAVWTRGGAEHPIRAGLWMVTLGFTFLTQLILHAWFWGTVSRTAEQDYGYMLALNILFAMQLAIICWPGAKHVGCSLAVSAGRRLSVVGRSRVPARAAPRREDAP